MDFSNIDFETIFFPEMTGWLFAAKVFFILFDFGVIAFIVYVWATTIYLRRLYIWDVIEFFTFRGYNVRLIDKDWLKIKKRLLTKKEAEWKLAVVEADLLVDDVLGRLGFAGKNLAEKLESYKNDIFSDLDAMKEADCVYRKIVLDPKIILDYQEAKQSFLAFNQGLKDVMAFRDK